MFILLFHSLKNNFLFWFRGHTCLWGTGPGPAQCKAGALPAVLWLHLLFSFPGFPGGAQELLLLTLARARPGGVQAGAGTPLWAAQSREWAAAVCAGSCVGAWFLQGSGDPTGAVSGAWVGRAQSGTPPAGLLLRPPTELFCLEF